MRSFVFAMIAAGCADYEAAPVCAGGAPIFDDALAPGWTMSTNLTIDKQSRTRVATGTYALEATLDFPYGLVQFERAGFETAGLGSVCLWTDDTTAPLNIAPAYARGTTPCAPPCSDEGDGTCWCYVPIAPHCDVTAGPWSRCEVPLAELLQSGFTRIDQLGIQWNRPSLEDPARVVHFDNISIVPP